MMRSFALTFVSVTLRLELPVLMAGWDMNYADASAYVAWACWVPDHVLVEWFMRRRGRVVAPA